MKRFFAVIMVCIISMNLLACSESRKRENRDDRDDRGNTSAEREPVFKTGKAISAEEFIRAMESAEYIYTEEEMTAEDLGISDTTNFANLHCGKFEGSVEISGHAYYFEFDSTEEAEKAYRDLRESCIKDGIAFKTVSASNGKKSVYTNDEDPNFGSEYVFSQVENTMIFAFESWDIDSEGFKYSHSLANLMEDLGY